MSNEIFIAEKKIKKYPIFALRSSYFRSRELLAGRYLFKNIIFRGLDFKDFAQIFDRIENIALRLCTVSLTHTRGLLGIRKSHLCAGG